MSGAQASKSVVTGHIAGFVQPNGPVLLDISPLRRHRDFRLVFAGQLVSAFGSLLTYVALPIQMSGPLLGNARAGFMAERFGVARSITWGGAMCVTCVLALVPLLPAFWRYRAAVSDEVAPSSQPAQP